MASEKENLELKRSVPNARVSAFHQEAPYFREYFMMASV